MIEGGGRTGLLLEAVEMFRGSREVTRQNLYGKLPPQATVSGSIDSSHPAGSEQRENLVGTQPHAGHWCARFGLRVVRKVHRVELVFRSGLSREACRHTK